MFRRMPVLWLVTLAGCTAASPENHYYTLTATEAPSVSPLAIHTLSLPEMTDRPEIVRLSGPNDVQILEYSRWAEPFEGMVRRVLAEDLGASMNDKDAKPIDVAIEEFYGDTEGTVTLKAHWQAQTPHSPVHYFAKTEKAESSDIDAMAAAMSRLLGELAHAIRSPK